MSGLFFYSGAVVFEGGQLLFRGAAQGIAGDEDVYEWNESLFTLLVFLAGIVDRRQVFDFVVFEKQEIQIVHVFERGDVADFVVAD